LDHCENVRIRNNEIARNGYYGILIAESRNTEIAGNLIEANDRSGIMLEYLYEGNDKLDIRNNNIRFNAGWGVESYATKNLKLLTNDMKQNGNLPEQQKVSSERKILMQ
jgi:parallel beta-helix repeat protein